MKVFKKINFLDMINLNESEEEFDSDVLSDDSEEYNSDDDSSVKLKKSITKNKIIPKSKNEVPTKKINNENNSQNKTLLNRKQNKNIGNIEENEDNLSEAEVLKKNTSSQKIKNIK